jgi:hypothetical protein
MKKILLSSVVVSALSLNVFADDIADLQAEIKALTTKVKKLEKKQKRTSKTLSKVKQHDAYDNIKFGLDFRNAVDVLDYKDNKSGETASDHSLLTSRLYLTMAASPMQDLIFQGKLAIYSIWGAHAYYDTSSQPSLKDWSASSKATDTVMRVKEAYFIYNTAIGVQPISFSIGRRPSTNGFLANYRENEAEPGSPLAHITNMEVNAAMVMLKFGRYVEGAYSKFVYGRAHSGDMNNVYGTGSNPWGPYASTTTVDDENVDFFVFLGDAYNNGQYQLAYQWAHIFNTKGQRVADSVNKAASGSADLAALSFKVQGVGEEINDFLDETTLFASVATTKYNPKEGYALLGSTESKAGYSFWAGALFPDTFTKNGKFGIEYNHGTKYWTPMTWAEDTASGSKIAVRGDAYEAYWNFNLFGVKYLPSQIRYTYAQHNYTPNVNCAGWVKPVDVDITSSDLRFAVSYRY